MDNNNNKDEDDDDEDDNNEATKKVWTKIISAIQVSRQITQTYHSAS